MRPHIRFVVGVSKKKEECIKKSCFCLATSKVRERLSPSFWTNDCQIERGDRIRIFGGFCHQQMIEWQTFFVFFAVHYKVKRVTKDFWDSILFSSAHFWVVCRKKSRVFSSLFSVSTLKVKKYLSRCTLLKIGLLDFLEFWTSQRDWAKHHEIWIGSVCI